MYTSLMPKTPRSTGPIEVGVRELRDHLSRWIDEARRGRSIVITDRGKPVARLTALEEMPPGLLRMIAEGRAQLPTAPAEPAGVRLRVKAKGSVSELVRDQRR